MSCSLNALSSRPEQAMVEMMSARLYGTRENTRKLFDRISSYLDVSDRVHVRQPVDEQNDYARDASSDRDIGELRCEEELMTMP